jgi:hypothetical protein
MFREISKLAKISQMLRRGCFCGFGFHNKSVCCIVEASIAMVSGRPRIANFAATPKPMNPCMQPPIVHVDR